MGLVLLRADDRHEGPKRKVSANLGCIYFIDTYNAWGIPRPLVPSY